MIPVPEKRIYDFERYGLGLFVHYGLFSLMGQGEWVQDAKGIAPAEYAKLADSFTAEHFSGDRLAKMAHDAGIKYITFTTRHHDGFSLYDTRGLNTFDAPHSAAKRDLVEDFVNGCNKYGIVPFLYHTTLDWRVPEFENDFPAYQQYLRESVKILCTQYGKIGGLWFDGNWSKNADWEEDALYGMIRKYQPEAMIINNTGLDKLGQTGHYEIDAVTFERGKPFPINGDGARKYLGSEVCQIVNSHWGYAKNDFAYKGVEGLLHELAACRRYGANYLLNIGPQPDGSIRLIEQGIFEEIGKWVAVYGEAIYNVRPAKDVVCEGENFVLKADRDGVYYLFVPGMGVLGSGNVMLRVENMVKTVIKNFPASIKSIRWIENNEELKFTQDGGDVTVDCTQYEYGRNYVVRVARIEV